MSTLIELAGRLDDDAGIVHAFATGIYDDLRDRIVRDLRDAATALRAAETGQGTVGCVSCVLLHKRGGDHQQEQVVDPLKEAGRQARKALEPLWRAVGGDHEET